MAFDVYLGPLWGVNRARIDFETEAELNDFLPPPFAVFEITNESFFDDANLVHRTFEEVKLAVEELVPVGGSTTTPDE